MSSQRKIPYIILNNYKFIKHRSAKRATYWKCQLYDGDFRVSVLSSLNGLQYTTYQILNIVKEILKSSSDVTFEKLTVPENLPKFPLKTYEEYLLFDALVSQDAVIAQYMVRRLAALGGTGLESVTRRIMKFLFNNELATHFNWKGRHNKTGFEQTATMNLVYEAAKLNFPSSEKSDMRIAENVKQWLKHASSRLKQSKARIGESSSLENC
nr:unnamed protein product [Callosobruchus analis]